MLEEIKQLYKKTIRLEKAYEKNPKAKVRNARIMKSYEATIRRLDELKRRLSYVV